MKKLLAAAVAAVCVTAGTLCGCVTISGVDGFDGKDGEDVSIHAIFEATNEARRAEGLEELTFLEFVSEYLSYSGEDVKNANSLQSSINRSLRSGVSIAAGFTERVISNGWWTTDTNWYFGSGAIVDIDKENGDAYVVTNCHVVYNEDALGSVISKKVYLFLYGQDYKYDVENCAIGATVVGASRSYDIALLKVEGSEILKNSAASAAEFVTSDDVTVGEAVYAIGNPEGYGLSATQGIVSKDSEYIEVNLSEENDPEPTVKTFRVLRTDAAINGGNSGGGLFNTQGKLVGIVNAKASDTDIDNMGYALPASNVRRLVSLMREQENSFGGSGGLNLPVLKAEYDYRECISKYHDDENAFEIVENVFIKEGGDGLEFNDSIRRIKITDASGNAVEDREVTRVYHFTDALLSMRSGYTLTLTVSRAGETVEVNVPVTYKYYD